MTATSTMLWIAAAFNFGIGLPGMLRGGASLEGRVIALLVAAFGVLYAITATDPPRYIPMLWVGVVGKIGVVALMGPAVARGQAPKFTGALLVGDALFVVLFLFLLLRGG